MKNAFFSTALGFDLSRHQCQGTWRITTASIDLLSTTCLSEPLAPEYQYLTDTQLQLSGTYYPMLSELLGPFATARNSSQWLLPTFSVVMASMFCANIAGRMDVVSIQPDGPVYTAWNLTGNEPYFVNYTSSGVLELQVPSLNACMPYMCWLVFNHCLQLSFSCCRSLCIMYLSVEVLV
jgi:hypothetical protein